MNPNHVYINKSVVKITIIDKPYKFLLKPKVTEYFWYNIKESPNNLFLHIFASPGPNKIAMFVSDEINYPNAEDCKWPPKERSSLLHETEFEPFILNEKNMIEYIADPKLKKESSYDIDSIAMKIDGYYWRFKAKICHISIQNLYNWEQNVTLSVTEYKELDLIPKPLLKKFYIFGKIYNFIKGSSLSQDERSSKTLIGTEYTYGEIELIHFLPLFNLLNKGKDEVFWDLGCGVGKVMLAASIGTDNYTKIYGVEMLESLCEGANQAIDSYCSEEKVDRSKFTVIQGDMTKIDWSNADVIYVSSLCFPDELVKAIAERGRLLKRGARILTLKKWPFPEVYKLIDDFKVKMTWGMTRLFIMERA